MVEGIEQRLGEEKGGAEAKEKRRGAEAAGRGESREQRWQGSMHKQGKAA